MHKFGVPQGGVLFGRGFTPPSPPPGGGGGGPPEPRKRGFRTPPPGVDFWAKIGTRGLPTTVKTDGRTIKIRKVSIWGVHLGENLSIFGAHSFRKRGPRETPFSGPSILTPPFWIHSKNPLFGGGGLKLSSEITFHQVHKSGYSEVPPRQPANRIFIQRQLKRRN